MRRRLGAGRDERPDLQLCDPCTDRHLGSHAQSGRRPANGCPAGFGLGRMGRRMVRGPLRPRSHAADRDPVVCGLHVPVRAGPELRTIVRSSGPAGIRFRRRMGRGGGAAGRSDSRRASRESPGNHAGRMGGRMGRGGAAVCPLFLRVSSRDGLACFVHGRAVARTSGFLRAALRGGTEGLSGVESSHRSHRRPAVRARDLPGAAVEGDAPGRADGNRSSGRLLRRHHLAADISAHRAAVCRCSIRRVT